MKSKLLLLLLLFGCRSSHPPQIEICIFDGFGADCTLANGEEVTKLPSQLNNYWLTNQEDMGKFSQWCYDTSQNLISKNMEDLRIDLKDR